MHCIYTYPCTVNTLENKCDNADNLHCKYVQDTALVTGQKASDVKLTVIQ